MFNNKDLKNEIEMYFTQIEELSSLMVERDKVSVENIKTIRDLAKIGKAKISLMNIE